MSACALRDQFRGPKVNDQANRLVALNSGMFGTDPWDLNMLPHGGQVFIYFLMLFL